MEDKLYEKIEDELKKFKLKVKEKGVEYAIEKAYELTVKQEIIDSIKYDHTLSNSEIKALISKENVLDELYDDWLSSGKNMREDINYSVDTSLEIISDKYKKDIQKTQQEVR